MIVILFWLLLALLIYAYLFYPLIVGLICAVKYLLKKKLLPNQNKDSFNTAITIVIPAYNEASCITKKLENTLQLEYPTDLIQIIVVADGCTDSTVDLVKQFKGVTVITNEKRLGKSAAINLAMQQIQSDIVVFTDANTLLNKSCLKNIIVHFSNTKIGAVACEKRIIESFDEHLVGKMEGLYWKYESLVKQWESSLHSVIGVAGDLFCIRKSLFTTIDSKIILDDFMISSSILKKGFTIAYEKKSFAYETATLSLIEEAKRKIRIGAGAAQSLSILGLLPYKNWWLNIQFISRRVIRWAISPIALIFIFIANYTIVQNGASQVYNLLFFFQLCFYILTTIGLFFHWLKQTNKLALTPFYFVFMNVCMLLGFISYFLNLQTVFWGKAKRVEI